TDIGAINSRAQLDRIKELVASGEQEAERYSAPCKIPDRGFFFPPTFFTGAAQASRIAREEIFGPVLTILSFRTPDEAIEKANNMYVAGAFIRSESGRYFQVSGEGGADPGTVNYPRGSRKDVRDAVLAAKNAENGWAGRTAFNRGQILYRLAEVVESRRDEL